MLIIHGYSVLQKIWAKVQSDPVIRGIRQEFETNRRERQRDILEEKTHAGQLVRAINRAMARDAHSPYMFQFSGVDKHPSIGIEFFFVKALLSEDVDPHDVGDVAEGYQVVRSVGRPDPRQYLLRPLGREDLPELERCTFEEARSFLIGWSNIISEKTGKLRCPS